VALTIDEIRNAIIEDRTTATALASDFYERIRKEDPEIGAFLTLCERSRAEAGRTDRPDGRGRPALAAAGGGSGGDQKT